MVFYNTNNNISVGDVKKCCNLDIINSKISSDFIFNSFVRSDIASEHDLTFFSNNRYSHSTNAKYIVTNKKLS